MEALNRLRETLGMAPLPPPPHFSPVPGVDCYKCDYTRLPIGDGEADHVITDIPWDNDWLKDEADDFAEWVARKLRPGGIFVTLYTPYNLPQLIEALNAHLKYVWVCSSPLHGNTQSPHKVYVTRSITLALIYSNSDKPYIHRSPSDLLPYSWYEKRKWHPHQQSLSVVQYLVEHLSAEGELVVDPTAGGWTTAMAAWRTGRRFLGSDSGRSGYDGSDPLEVAKKRFQEEKK
jgi:DNA modification methylase